MSEAVRQRYALATGKGLTQQPSKAGSPGYAKGGTVRKGAGGSVYGKGGKTSKK